MSAISHYLLFIVFLSHKLIIPHPQGLVIHFFDTFLLKFEENLNWDIILPTMMTREDNLKIVLGLL